MIELVGDRHVFCSPIRFNTCTRNHIVRFAVRTDSSTVANSTNAATTAEVSTEMYGQRNLCEQQGRNGKAPPELLGSSHRRNRPMSRRKLQFQPEPTRHLLPSRWRCQMALTVISIRVSAELRNNEDNFSVCAPCSDFPCFALRMIQQTE